MVGSWFCELPNPERRVAVFVAGADESTGRAHTDPFLFGGFVARERLWSRSFAPAWQRRVLNGPPKIDWLHMADIKSPKWRAAHGLTPEDVEHRLDEAFALIDAAGGLYPVAYRVDAGHLRGAFAEAEVKLVMNTEGGLAVKRFEPDYYCFVQWAFRVLLYVNLNYPEAEKVDFVIERNGRITKHIQRFHASMGKTLKNIDGAKHLARLVGELIPGGKDRVPLQAADLLVWHTQAADANSLSVSDERRYAKTIRARDGWLDEEPNDTLTEFAKHLGKVLAGEVSDDDDESLQVV